LSAGQAAGSAALQKAKAAPGAALRGVGRAALAGAKSAAKNPQLWGTLGAMAAHAAGIPGGALLGHLAGSKGAAPAVSHALGTDGKADAATPHAATRGRARASVPVTPDTIARGQAQMQQALQAHTQPARGRARASVPVTPGMRAGRPSRSASLKPPPGLSGAELRQHHSDGLRTAMNSGDNEGINYHAGEINKLNKAAGA
jgi:hypothetical protein